MRISKRFREYLISIDQKEWKYNGWLGEVLIYLLNPKRKWVDTSKLTPAKEV